MFSPTIRPPTAPTLPLPFRGHRTNPVRRPTPKTAIGGDHPAKVRPVTQRRLPASPHPRPDGRTALALGHPRARLDRRAVRGRAAPRHPPRDRRRRVPQPRPGPRLRRRTRRTHRLRLLRRARARPAGRHRLRRLAPLRAPPPSPARPGGGQTRPGGEGVHPQRRRGPRPHRSRHAPTACSCSKACGAGSCPTTTSCNKPCTAV